MTAVLLALTLTIGSCTDIMQCGQLISMSCVTMSEQYGEMTRPLTLMLLMLSATRHYAAVFVNVRQYTNGSTFGGNVAASMSMSMSMLLVGVLPVSKPVNVHVLLSVSMVATPIATSTSGGRGIRVRRR